MAHTWTPHWSGDVLILELNPTEGTKKPQTYLSVTLVSLCVSLQRGTFRGLKVETKIETFSQDCLSFLGNLQATPSPSYNPCPVKRL